ncbi:MAG: type I restriction enzyme HsdR N-terminal domain-containing protein [Deltaproteobacteria bacterium]|nr:type I restriction enzyme HsdR N-terminal domain-containing protein [Deltaproteobacteria bacterium]
MSHPLVLGQLKDYVTGETLADTLDERLRQELAHRLLDELGYQRAEVEARRELYVDTGSHSTTSRVDFVISLDGRVGMVVRYAPGALVVRERPTIAVARLLEPYVVPRAVITNGRDARVLDGNTGKVLATGLQAIPSRDQLASLCASLEPSELTAKRRAGEERILVTFDALDDGCNCGPNLEH